MVDDFTWFFTSEGGRDRILRDEIEGLQSATSAAHRQSSQLSSRLAHLQGSIESRLSALSAAFDAYVELGDVREQLAAYPDTRAARRDVVETIEALAAGAEPEPLETANSDYWLPYATNAVIAVSRGDDPAPARDQALALARESDLYVTAAAGALGHADVVADRVAGLLVGDGTLTPPQEALWEAVLAGTFGDVWAALDQQWRPALGELGPSTDSASSNSWNRRIDDAAESDDPTQQLRWLHALMNGGHATPADENAVRAGLRGIVTELVAQGVGREAELLRRSRELRARIENPTARPQSTRTEKQRPENERLEKQWAGRTVAGAVLQAFLSGSGDAVARTWLTRWVAPGLTDGIASLEAAYASTPPVTTTAKTPGGTFPVTPEGPDPVGWGRALKNIEAFGAVSPARLGVLTALTALFAVAAFVLALVGSSGWAISLVVVAVGFGIGAAIALRDRRAWREQREVDRGRAQKAVIDAQDRAVAEEQARRLTAEETRQLAGSLRDLLLQG